MSKKYARIDYNSLFAKIIQQFSLPLDSIHGPPHWARVEEFGLRLAHTTGADVEVVRLFSLFHDAQRISESDDPEHGPRGAILAAELRGTGYQIDDDRFGKLTYACTHHTYGPLTQDATIGTCWDADRLDLFRVSVIPDPRKLNTAAARDREMITWALQYPRRS